MGARWQIAFPGAGPEVTTLEVVVQELVPVLLKRRGIHLHTCLTACVFDVQDLDQPLPGDPLRVRASGPVAFNNGKSICERHMKTGIYSYGYKCPGGTLKIDLYRFKLDGGRRPTVSPILVSRRHALPKGRDN